MQFQRERGMEFQRVCNFRVYDFRGSSVKKKKCQFAI